MIQPDLFSPAPVTTSVLGDRDGETYEPKRDRKRLNSQAVDVFLFMLKRDWLTLDEIQRGTGRKVQSISARIRDFRKEKFSSHTVDTMHIGNGVWVYRLIPNKKATWPGVK
jgi:hypothetical protein